MMNVMRRALTLFVATAIATVPARSQPSSSTPRMTDSVGVVQGAARYIVERYGTDLMFNSEIKCGSMKQCHVEKQSDPARSLGEARRGVLLAAFRREVAGVRVATKGTALGCDDAIHVCKVQGAARYFEIREPTFANDTATIRVHFYESSGRFLRQQADVIHLIKGQGSSWMTVSREAYGFHAK